MINSSMVGAGLSFKNRYRESQDTGWGGRLALRALLGVAAFVLVSLVWHWHAGLVAAGIAAPGDMVYRRCLDLPVIARRRGAAGERATARMLRPLLRRGYVVLQDRVLPHAGGGAGHLVIGPTGVYVVDSRKWPWDVRIAGSRGRLWIGRNPADQEVRAVASAARAVSDVLWSVAGRRVKVVPLVAVHGARLPRWGALRASGVVLMRAPRVRAWITRQAVRLDTCQVSALGAVAERLLPPAARG
ncbi:NERD domain-containing protein [Planomonospora sp. ID67723]|uniref:nuclease-related domain-containing protein n=1 Tax=Planomonospora sp. ID67723 TaxID=2738134 RepID=UPI0018C430D3|nr:nuclease-related domain-containing protein [Planomonospora sp. ID67723]MBG0832062.1 NERD domain-containing protein [Planomonospora sp. ID67723]